MAGTTPTLGEIENIAQNPGVGSTSTRPIINTQEVAKAYNAHAQAKAEADWRKYNLFLGNLKDVYKQLGEVQGMALMDRDRPELHQKAADILEKINDDPNKFFMGGAEDIQKDLGSLMSQAAQSAQDRIYDTAHSMYLDRDPSLNTDENRALITGYRNAPLGQRKQYLLNMPSLYDPAAIGKLASDQIAQQYSNTGLSPDGMRIMTQDGIRYDPAQFKKITDTLYNLPDKTGVTLSRQVAKRFEALPESLQTQYKQKNPDDPVKAFYDDTVLPFRQRDQVTKTSLKDDAFALELYKNKDKLEQMKVKFGYDKALEGMKLGREEDLAKFKKNLQNKSKKEQTGALNGMVDTMVNDALLGASADNGFWTPGKGGGDFAKMNVSPSTLNIFSTTKEVGGKAVKTPPDELQVSKDGKEVRVVFNKPGSSAEDESKTKTFSIDEFKVRFGKDVLGVSATEKEINSDGDDDDESSSSSTSTSTQTVVKKPKLY
jgi:hypothetical protein